MFLLIFFFLRNVEIFLLRNSLNTLNEGRRANGVGWVHERAAAVDVHLG